MANICFSEAAEVSNLLFLTDDQLKTPLAYLNLMIDSSILQNLATWTHDHIASTSTQTEKDKFSEWWPRGLRKDELAVSLAFILFQEIVDLKRVKDYWKDTWLWSFPVFKAIFSRHFIELGAKYLRNKHLIIYEICLKEYYNNTRKVFL